VQREFTVDARAIASRLSQYYRAENAQIYYKQTLGIGLQLKMLVQYDDSGISIRVNPIYHHLVQLSLPHVVPPGRHVSDVLGIKLLSLGFAPLHAAAFALNNEATVICAPADTGKTVSVLHAVSRGCDYLSEDIAITNGTQLWGCPQTFGLAPYARLTGGSRLRYIMYQHIPIVRHFLQGTIHVDAMDVLGSDRIISQAKVKRVVILSSSTEHACCDIDKQQAISTIFHFNRQEFSYRNPLLLALQQSGKINISHVLLKETQIIHNLIHSAEEVVWLKGNPDYFKTCIDDIINLAR
jgi:hypothetical protein